MTELLSPAGDFATALSAFEAGADAVYCGLADFSARAFATNLSYEDLENLMGYARKYDKKVYVTFNTLLDESQLEGAVETLARLEEIAPSALIVQDLGVANLVRKRFPSLVLHASTQLVAHNLEGVLALGDLGFKRVVLSRELSFDEIASIAKRSRGIELEVFIHGALCYSISGLCLYGAMEKGRSGNRGKCPYLCRQCVNGKYPFSMKDLRLGEDVRKLADLGIASLKIEGRMKSALYVASVTNYYRAILDGAKAKVSAADLETVFSRATTTLRFEGDNLDVIDADSLGHKGTFIGKVKKVTRDREGFKWLRFHTFRALERHDGLQFDALNDEGRHLGLGINEMRSAISRRNVFEVNAGEDVEILLPEDFESDKLHGGDAIYCSMSNQVKREFPAASFRPSDYDIGLALAITVGLEPNRVYARALGIETEIAAKLEKAKSPEKTYESVKKGFGKLGGTGFYLDGLVLNDADKLFAPMSLINDLRRDLVEKLTDLKERRRKEKIDAALD